MYTEGLQLKVARLGREEFEKLAVNALYHLRVVSGSRNSFTSDYLESAQIAGIGFPKRDGHVEALQRQATEFIQREDA